MTDLPDDSGGEGEKDRNFVAALARGLDVLRAFKPDEAELTNTDLAERTGLPKPTVSRLTHTLCELDYLAANPQSGAYRLGAGVLQLGYGALSGMDIVTRAGGVMRDLASGPNTFITCALAERHRCHAVYVATETSVEDISLRLSVGSRLPLFRSAIGRAIVVASDAPARADLLDMARIDDPGGDGERRRWIAAADEEYRARGYVTGYGDWRADVNGIAVPVRALDGSRIWGLNVGGPSFHVTREELEAVYAPRLIAAARALDPRGWGPA